MEKAPEDHHCLFHTFEFLQPSRTMMEWRSALCNRIVEAANREGNHDQWLDKANAASALLGRKEYSDFFDWIQAMTTGAEWGNSDFIMEFCKECQGEAFCFSSRGNVFHYRPAEVLEVHQTFFLINLEDAQGKLFAGHNLYNCIACTDTLLCTGNPYHFNPVSFRGPRNLRLQALISELQRVWMENKAGIHVDITTVSRYT
jgi:hypothetical protein